MHRFRLHRPSHGTVVAYVALVLAMTGSAAAVGTLHAKHSKPVKPVVLVKQASGSHEYTSTSSWSTVRGMTGKFKVPKGGHRPTLFTYSAECSVSGNPGDWAAIRIQVDGHDVTPDKGTGESDTSDLDFAFCSPQMSSNLAETEGWIGASVQGYKKLAPGTHHVKVQTIVFGGTAVRLDDMQLSVVAEA